MSFAESAAEGVAQVIVSDPSFSTNQFVHSFHVANATMTLVKEGKKSFYSQYLLNPSIKLSDGYFVGVMLIMICTVRFIFAGAHHERARNYPSVFKTFLGKFCKSKRESKMSENLW